jgi:hypothetical protein
MRNPLATGRVGGSVPRKRRGPVWINLLGRDLIVNRPSKLGIAGTLAGSLGVVCIVWGSVEVFDPVRVGVVLFLAGVISICFDKLRSSLRELRTRNLAADEIYKIGYERGQEESYEEGRADGYREGMINGERRHSQVVVPFTRQKCTDCGHMIDIRPMASVAGRD